MFGKILLMIHSVTCSLFRDISTVKIIKLFEYSVHTLCGLFLVFSKYCRSTMLLHMHFYTHPLMVLKKMMFWFVSMPGFEPQGKSLQYFICWGRKQCGSSCYPTENNKHLSCSFKLEISTIYFFQRVERKIFLSLSKFKIFLR